MNFTIYTPQEKADENEKEAIADFLYEHLDEFGDEHAAIMKCIDFALDDQEKFGGFIVLSKDKGNITGAVVVNKTGMEGYIPENILVYIAVDRNVRGQGLGKQLMTKSFELAEGSIKLHVEPDNPARYLYEKLGFTSKYLEMRLMR